LVVSTVKDFETTRAISTIVVAPHAIRRHQRLRLFVRSVFAFS
jgi:hypothetical protein